MRLLDRSQAPAKRVLIAFVVTAIAAACVDGPPITCPYTPFEGNYGMVVEHSIPNQCPVWVNWAGEPRDFGLVVLDSGADIEGERIDVIIIAEENGEIAMPLRTNFFRWIKAEGEDINKWRASLGLTYNAGLGKPAGGRATDRAEVAVHLVPNISGVPLYATGKLTAYVGSRSASIEGPSFVPTAYAYGQTPCAFTAASFIGPEAQTGVGFTWFIDDVEVAAGSTFSMEQEDHPSEGWHSLRVVSTDAYGIQAEAQKWVEVTYNTSTCSN